MNRHDPDVGEMFWWYSHDRLLLVLTVLEETKPDTMRLKWEIYKGLVSPDEPRTGEIEWTMEEWNVAHLKQFVPPLTAANLGPDEELCRTCDGMYFETERDFEILGCIWCSGTGKRKKRPEEPKPTQRSPLHPEIPPKISA